MVMDLRRIRISKKLTQQQLSELTGISQSTIASIETGNIWPELSSRLRFEYILGEIDWTLTRFQNIKHRQEGEFISSILLDYLKKDTELRKRFIINLLNNIETKND